MIQLLPINAKTPVQVLFQCQWIRCFLDFVQIKQTDLKQKKITSKNYSHNQKLVRLFQKLCALHNLRQKHSRVTIETVPPSR